MNRQFSIVIIVLLFILIAVAYFAFRLTQRTKQKLIKAEISAITICKPNPICNTKFELTPLQIESFVSKWNNSNSMGFNKISCSYYMDVFLTNGKKRSFGIAEEDISENWGGGYIYSIGNKDYFDSLYSVLKSQH